MMNAIISGKVLSLHSFIVDIRKYYIDSYSMKNSMSYVLVPNDQVLVMMMIVLIILMIVLIIIMIVTYAFWLCPRMLKCKLHINTTATSPRVLTQNSILIICLLLY